MNAKAAVLYEVKKPVVVEDVAVPSVAGFDQQARAFGRRRAARADPAGRAMAGSGAERRGGPYDVGAGLLDGELGEDRLQGRRGHQGAEMLDRIVGDDFAAVQDHDMGTDPFHGFELVRAEHYDFAARGELLDEAA